MTELSVLFVNYNSWRVLVAALRSLLAAPPTRADGTPLPFEVVVVDNASPQRDPAAEAELEALLRGCAGKLIRHGENGGYATGMNLAYRASRGRYVLVSNPDVLFEPGCIDGLLRRLERDPATGAAAPEGFWDRELHGRLPPNILPTLRDLCALTLAALSPRHVHRYSARRTRDALRVWDARDDVELDMLSGCCFLMARALIEQIATAPGIGPFDERFPLYYEDTDLSMRVRRAGKKVVQVHGARLVHLYNRSGETDHGEAMRRYWVSRRAYYRKWYGPLGGAFYDLTRRLLGTRWAAARAQRPPHELHELGASGDKPVIRLDRAHARLLVEVALDPHFYLAAGMFGAGDRFELPDSVFANFGPTTYFFRVLALDGGAARQLGVWRYTRVFPPEWLAPPAPPAAVPASAAHARGGGDG